MRKLLAIFISGVLLGAVIVPQLVNALEPKDCNLPLKIGQLGFIPHGEWSDYKARVVGYHISDEGACEYSARIHPGPQYYVNEKYILVKADNLSAIEGDSGCRQ